MHVECAFFACTLRARYVYHLLDRYDEKHGITAMARTTGYPASILAQLIAQKTIKEKARAHLPLKKLGGEEKICNEILAELEKRQVKIVESLS